MVSSKNASALKLFQILSNRKGRDTKILGKNGYKYPATLLSQLQNVLAPFLNKHRSFVFRALAGSVSRLA